MNIFIIIFIVNFLMFGTIAFVIIKSTSKNRKNALNESDTNEKPQANPKAKKYSFMMIAGIVLLVTAFLLPVGWIAFSKSIFDNFDSYMTLCFISFFAIALGIFLLIFGGVKKSQLNHPINKIHAHINEQIIKESGSVNDDYYIRYCQGCGENLKPTETKCPYCGLIVTRRK